MKQIIWFLGLAFAFFLPKTSQAQEDPNLNVVDDIQFDLKSVTASGDTLVVDLFAISYDKNPREFRLNVFATALIDAQEESHMLTSVQIDRVIVQLSDRENYLNYLLHQDKPVNIKLKLTPMTEEIKNAKMVKIVFNALEEEGQFLDAFIDLEQEKEQ
ncbi:hypothetical protein [Sphingobacterium sp.]|uniref:hypothetical protein n=1 Tax=Sphingobacterium sp. TaxID=341027 RepID=UPI0028A87063|nr:hypothetical protein [Sphingobacterium sp.]